MDEAMESEHESEGASGAMQGDSEVAGHSGTSGSGAGPSGVGIAGPSWAAEPGPSWAGETGPNQVHPYERRRQADYWECRYKRKNSRNTGEVPAKRQKRRDEGSAVANLLSGMTVCGPDDDDVTRRSLFEHERLVWWTANNWQTQSGSGAKPTVYESVPEPIAVDPPTEPVNFNREDVENAAAERARLSHIKKQRRLAVSESDVDAEHAKEDFEQFLLFREKKSEVTSDSDSSYSSLFDSSTDSSDSSTKKPSVLEDSDSDESCMG